MVATDLELGTDDPFAVGGTDLSKALDLGRIVGHKLEESGEFFLNQRRGFVIGPGGRVDRDRPCSRGARSLDR